MGRTKGTSTAPRADSQSANLARLKVGESYWVAATGIRPPIPASSRIPAAMKQWQFQAAYFIAVPQSSLTREPERLWKITRIADKEGADGL